MIIIIIILVSRHLCGGAKYYREYFQKLESVSAEQFIYNTLPISNVGSRDSEFPSSPSNSSSGIAPTPKLNRHTKMAISFSLSEVVALAVESFCYGIYFALFGSSVKVLFSKRKTISGAMPLLGLAGAFAVLITWHVITDAVRMVYAFKNSQVPIGGDLYFANVASALSLIKTSLYLVITILFDGFILHRCWIIWDRSLVVILLPFLIFLADIGTGIAAVEGLSGLTRGDSVFIAKQEKISKSFFSSTVAVNGLCS
ncbi:hypothetical protein BJY52DRAFT_1422542, partial [Lactarius psammicola]